MRILRALGYSLLAAIMIAMPCLIGWYGVAAILKVVDWLNETAPDIPMYLIPLILFGVPIALIIGFQIEFNRPPK